MRVTFRSGLELISELTRDNANTLTFGTDYEK